MQQLETGARVTRVRSFSDADVRAFAGLSGDANPIHLDEQAATRSVFGRRVVHGLLAGSQFSAMIATEMPGPGSIYLEQDLRFVKPIFLDEDIEFALTLLEVPKPGLYRIETTASAIARGVLAISGSALVLCRQPLEGKKHAG